MDAPSGNTEMGVAVFTNSTWLADFVASQVGANGIVQEALSTPCQAPLRPRSRPASRSWARHCWDFGGFFFARRRRG